MKIKRKKPKKSNPHSFLGKFVSIQSGTFAMGSTETEKDLSGDEVQHQVTLTKDFEMMATQVTQKMWAEVMGTNPSYFKGENLPVESVSWNDCQKFIERLNEKQKKWIYRLPTEAEWEYASSGNPTESLGQFAWFYENSESKTHPVGQKLPNQFGLYDMLGNVWEWCQDWYGQYPKESVTDPTGPTSGSFRVFRGGCWGYTAPYLRSAFRSYDGPGVRYYSLGFRLVSTQSSGSRNTLFFNPLTLSTTEARKKAKVVQKIQEVRNILKEIEDIL